MTILVTNPKDYTVHLRSFDGDSVAVYPKSRRVSVASKFSWQVPAGVLVEQGVEEFSDPTTIVPGRIPVPKMRPKGHHNNSRQEPMMSAAQMRELASKKREMREQAQASLAASKRSQTFAPAPSAFDPSASQAAAAAAQLKKGQ